MVSPFLDANACMSLKPTPQPHNSLKGYSQSSCLGSKTAIGADIVPIVGENRILAYHGLKVINENPRPGFEAILKQVKKENLTITYVVFIIAPRINAAGRMKHGNHAVTVLCETDINLAAEYAIDIDTYNTDRRDADKRITIDALAQIEENKEQDRFTSVVYNENWHKGVIGIVASRLIETFYASS